MVTSPLSILFEIFFVILYNTVNTIMVVFNLFIKLLYSLSFGISVAGPLGIVLAFVILMPLTYFLVKFLFGSAKIALMTLFILFPFLIIIFLFV